MNEVTTLRQKQFNVHMLASHVSHRNWEWMLYRGSRTFGKGNTTSIQKAANAAMDFANSKGWTITNPPAEA